MLSIVRRSFWIVILVLLLLSTCAGAQKADSPSDIPECFYLDQIPNKWGFYIHREVPIVGIGWTVSGTITTSEGNATISGILIARTGMLMACVEETLDGEAWVLTGVYEPKTRRIERLVLRARYHGCMPLPDLTGNSDQKLDCTMTIDTAKVNPLKVAAGEPVTLNLEYHISDSKARMHEIMEYVQLVGPDGKSVSTKAFRRVKAVRGAGIVKSAFRARVPSSGVYRWEVYLNSWFSEPARESCPFTANEAKPAEVLSRKMWVGTNGATELQIATGVVGNLPEGFRYQPGQSLTYTLTKGGRSGTSTLTWDTSLGPGGTIVEGDDIVVKARITSDPVAVLTVYGWHNVRGDRASEADNSNYSLYVQSDPPNYPKEATMRVPFTPSADNITQPTLWLEVRGSANESPVILKWIFKRSTGAIMPGTEIVRMEIMDITVPEAVKPPQPTTIDPRMLAVSQPGKPAPVAPPAPTAGGVSLASVAGDVSVRPAGSVGWRPGKTFEALKAGSSIRTGTGGSAVVELPRGRIATFAEGTEASLGSQGKDGQVTLRNGTVASTVVPLKGETYRVTTPLCGVEAQGTAFVVQHNPSAGKSTITVQFGYVRVTPSAAGAAPFTLSSGMERSVTGTTGGALVDSKPTSPSSPGGNYGDLQPTRVDQPTGGWPEETPHDFNGTWSTTWGDWGEFVLQQDGTRVTGTYYGGTHKLEGTVENNVARLKWTDPSGLAGSAKFTLSADANFITGSRNDQVGSDEARYRWDAKRKGVEGSAPPPPAVTSGFTGTWKTTWGDWGEIVMLQEDNRVTGTWGGDGSLDGTVSGKVVRLKWKNRDGTLRGGAKFTMSEDGKTLKGSRNDWKDTDPDFVQFRWDAERVSGP
ncbi:MAG: FecR domain-containing protein [Armatimonadota bacterium]